jgi:hypothetical protein
MTRPYTCEDAERDLEAAHERFHDLRQPDPTLAVAFAEIVNRLLAGLSPSDFADQPQIVAFVFKGLFSLREPVFNSGCIPRTEPARTLVSRFRNRLRARLMECNAGGTGGYCVPDNVNPLALWDYYHKEFLPVVAALRSTGDAKSDLSFLLTRQ